MAWKHIYILNACNLCSVQKKNLQLRKNKELHISGGRTGMEEYPSLCPSLTIDLMGTGRIKVGCLMIVSTLIDLKRVLGLFPPGEMRSIDHCSLQVFLPAHCLIIINVTVWKLTSPLTLQLPPPVFTTTSPSAAPVVHLSTGEWWWILFCNRRHVREKGKQK